MVHGLEKTLNGANLWQTMRQIPKFKHEGNLILPNMLYMTEFLVQNPYDKSDIWGWIKIMLLAKNFEDAETLLFTCMHLMLVIIGFLLMKEIRAL